MNLDKTYYGKTIIQSIMIIEENILLALNLKGFNLKKGVYI